MQLQEYGFYDKFMGSLHFKIDLQRFIPPPMRFMACYRISTKCKRKVVYQTKWSLYCSVFIQISTYVATHDAPIKVLLPHAG